MEAIQLHQYGGLDQLRYEDTDMMAVPDASSYTNWPMMLRAASFRSRLREP